MIKLIYQLKTFSRVLQIDPTSWYARYCIADVQRSIGLLEPAVETLESILVDRPDELGVQVVLAQTQLARARTFIRTGHLARAELGFLDALERALTLARARKASRVAIKVAADAMTDLAALETYGDADGVDVAVGRALELARDEDVDGKMPALGIVTVVSAQQVPDDCPLRWRAALGAVLLHKLHVLLENAEPSSAGAAWADLALAILALGPGLPSIGSGVEEIDLRRSAIQCIRLALHREPRNPALWSALGAIAIDLSPALAQHAFIRAAEQNPRSALPWTHLGVLYLAVGDRALANQALLRAQVLDPEWPAAWLGQAALAMTSGDVAEARALVDHAWMLSEGTLVRWLCPVRAEQHSANATSHLPNRPCAVCPNRRSTLRVWRRRSSHSPASSRHGRHRIRRRCSCMDSSPSAPNSRRSRPSRSRRRRARSRSSTSAARLTTSRLATSSPMSTSVASACRRATGLARSRRTSRRCR